MKHGSFYIFILVIGVLIASYMGCSKPVRSDCGINKMDALIKDVVGKYYVYNPVPPDSITTILLYTNGLEPGGKEYFGFHARKVLTILTDRLDTIQGIWMYLKGTNLNYDTTTAKVKVEYHPDNMHVAVTMLSYSFDTVACTWKVLDSLVNPVFGMK